MEDPALVTIATPARVGDVLSGDARVASIAPPQAPAGLMSQYPLIPDGGWAYRRVGRSIVMTKHMAKSLSPVTCAHARPSRTMYRRECTSAIAVAHRCAGITMQGHASRQAQIAQAFVALT